MPEDRNTEGDKENKGQHNRENKRKMAREKNAQTITM